MREGDLPHRKEKISRKIREDSFLRRFKARSGCATNVTSCVLPTKRAGLRVRRHSQQIRRLGPK